ncbi:hypothetical protein [Agarilytica rhodophyticola]|uniref:hypothetical protein n=1 Tax=Agarilytica rhodophyticola TaxID=1737490 RepID=UPI000B3460B5|nr:hypothetical protein [Agarilytica rhodophyticola]
MAQSKQKAELSTKPRVQHTQGQDLAAQRREAQVLAGTFAGKESTSQLPPPRGEAATERGAQLVASRTASGVRAKVSGALQRVTGNARLGRMLARNSRGNNGGNNPAEEWADDMPLVNLEEEKAKAEDTAKEDTAIKASQKQQQEKQKDEKIEQAQAKQATNQANNKTKTSVPTKPSVGSGNIAKTTAGALGSAAGAGVMGSAIGGMPKVEEGGGGAPNVETGDIQGSNEEEGAAELEERLAKADPERAAADQADPGDVAMDYMVPKETGDLGEQSSAADNSQTLSPAPQAPASPTKLPDADNSNTPAPDLQSEDVSSADGFSGDEPALGGGALEGFGSQNLSAAEQQVAFDSLAENIGTGAGISGGGGGGSAIADKPQPEVPDVSAQKPVAALATASALPPVQMHQSLGGLASSINNEAKTERDELKAKPPAQQRPTGSPINLYGKASTAAKADDNAAKPVAQAEAGRDNPTPEPAKTPEPPPSPAENLPTPQLQGGDSGQLSADEVQQLAHSVGSLPTKDAGLYMSTGPSPTVELAGNASPARIAEQNSELQSSMNQHQQQGRQDVAQEMGENTKIYPSVATEMLTAKVPSGGGGGEGTAEGTGAAGGSSLPGSVDPATLNFLANKEKGGEIEAAANTAQGDLAAKKSEYNTKVTDEKAKSAKDIVELEAKSSADQAQARGQAQGEVKASKTEWTQEQEKTIREANKEADKEITKGRDDIQKKKQDADTKATQEIRKGNNEAERERKKAEDKAAAEKRKGKKEGKGFFGWLASKAKAFFDRIKAAIKSAFDLARKLIKKAIEMAKKAAMWAIEQARKAIVAAIQLVGKLLIAIGDRLLAAFPALRDKFRKFINSTIDKAVAKVNQYAEKLKKGVSALLDLLAAGLNKLIGWLEKGMLAAVDAYAKAVDGAIKFAEKTAQAFGAFMTLIKDVAAGPVKWIGNLGAAVIDGIKNHLWKAFKAAVQQWFNSKLEQVLGLGTMVWGLIKSGGLSVAKVGKMAWEGIKAIIPAALTRILVEKLVAMIVPAAGAVMAIVEGLQAAWGTVQQIVTAFNKFMAFLKAVKKGNAGPQFASALAAAAVAVIDFVANWLIAKLTKGAAKIGGKIKALAKKILGRKKGKRQGKQVIGKASARGGMAKRGKADNKRTLDKSGASKKPKKTAVDKKEEARKRKKQERIDRARKELPPKIKSFLAKKPSRIRMKAKLLVWKLKYRLSSLKIEGKRKLRFIGKINPVLDLGNGWVFTWDEILRAIDEVAGKYQEEHEETKKNAPKQQNTLQPGVIDAAPRHGAAGTMMVINQYDTGTFDTGEDDKIKIIRTKGFYSGSAKMFIHNPTRAVIDAGSNAKAGRSYGKIIDDLAESGLKNTELGNALGAKFANASMDLKRTPQQRKLIAELYGLLNFEATHPSKKMEHRRDLVHAMMLSQTLSNDDKTIEDIENAPTAGIQGGSIQKGAKDVTKKALTKDEKGNYIEGYGKDAALPENIKSDEKKRLDREINNFKSWADSSKAFQDVQEIEPTKANLIKQIKDTLNKYLYGF